MHPNRFFDECAIKTNLILSNNLSQECITVSVIYSKILMSIQRDTENL